MDVSQRMTAGRAEPGAEPACRPGSDKVGLSDQEEELHAMAGLYRFLGRCLEEEVDEDLLALCRGDLRAVLNDLGNFPEGVLLGSEIQETLSTLAEEFTGLFVAPGAVSPYRSVFETGCMFQAPCDEAVAAYRDAGLEFRGRYSGEFPDHIGIMLGFVGWLAEREAESLGRADTREAENWRARRKSFLLDQLGPWGPGWCRRAASLANHQFYRAILEIAEGVLSQDIGSLASRGRLKELRKLNQRVPVRLEYDADFRKASGL